MLVLLEIVLVAAIVFAVAAFAVGALGGMTNAPPDRGDDGLPPGRLSSHDVDRARFGLAFRGYRMSEVDAVLDRLRAEIAGYEAELAALGTPPEGRAHSADPAVCAPGAPQAGAVDG